MLAKFKSVFKRETSYLDALPFSVREEVMAAMEATSVTDIR